MTVDDALREAALRLEGSPTPRLDAEVLLSHVCSRDRTWLYTWGDRELTEAELATFVDLIERRVGGCPVAYLTGVREFWGLSLQTSASTLIPRPDTECLVEVALACAGEQGALLDLGTGTGAIALAFASEKPQWQVTGADLTEETVALARANAQALGIVNATFRQSDWFAAMPGERYDLIVSNPPYIANDDPHLGQADVRFEPRSALVAEAHGMAALLHLVEMAPDHLRSGAWLWLEHGYDQAAAVRDALTQRGFQQVESYRDLGGHERVSGGQWC
ncbi:peptide chain release factor N(5)-glutamine methyltransferase [Salinicola avicenniae]|uniref:peptide chain release factor N(5)-glutamine methyltransferase n=1 Tax=Salinicola avicenniae TaxID=2916836 RepID=UPI0020747A84|nr:MULTISPECIES: peptide chain release factor N(5)-glutamine methyltransferase [unclassified Salinicola]